MKTKLITFALISAVSMSVQASFWDTWFSDSSAETAAPALSSTPVIQDATQAVVQTTLDAATSIAKGLIPTLTKQLGVSENQANGGMGALFQIAKDNLDTSDFSQLSQSIPDMTSLLAAAPALGSDGENPLGSWLAKAGSAGETLNDLAQLKSQFDALGLDTAMISKFALAAISYLQSEGGQDTAALLQKGLGALLGGKA